MGRIFLGEIELTQQTVVSAITQEVNTVSGEVNTHVSNASTHLSQGDRTNIDSITGSVGTMAYEDVSSYSSATEVNTALGNKANISDIEDFFDDAKYEDSGTSKVINFYHGNSIKSTINADDFIKDGMISGVTLETKSGTTYIVINWNTDAGIQTTELDIGDVFDADNYYQKSETSGKTEISTALSGITELMEKSELVTSAALNDLNDNKLDVSAYTPTDLSNYYQKSETSGKTEISTALTGKSNTGHTHDDRYYTESEIDTKLDAKSNTGHTHSQYLTGITSSQVTTALGFTPTNNTTFAAHTADTTVHVTAQDKATWNAKADGSASGITAMTGYEIASSGSSIATTDTLNQAIGKLEKMIDELKQFISDKELTIAAALTDLDNRLKAIE